MPSCATCLTDKAASAFTKNVRNKTGLASSCRDCRSAYGKKHYSSNRESYLAKARAWEARMRGLISEAKAKPCADCGGSFPPCVMDFDHLPGTKKAFNVSMGRKIGLEKVRAEIAKCEVVCANCHRIRTFTRQR